MNSHFIEQVQILMQVQQIKCAETVFGKSNYMWLCSKRTPIIWMSTRDEYLIRQALLKVTADQQVMVMKKLLTWLDNNPEAHCLKIPEIVIQMLNNTINSNMLNDVTFSRMDSFRNSLRRFSLLKNKVGPSATTLAPSPNVVRRSVTFNEVPIVYKIKHS